MEFSIAIICALIGYLIGSVSFARIGLKLAGIKRDISELEIPVEGADETARVEIFGANAASMILGAKAGILIGIMDMLKAALPMIILRFILYPTEHYYLIVWVSVLVGHNWPLYFGFKGGRGFSVIFGGLFIVDLIASITLPIIGILFGLFVAGNMMIGYISWVFFMPIWFLFRTSDLFFFFCSFFIMILFILSTRPEVKTMAKYRREGKLEEYMQGLYASSPRWRGMKRMQDTVDKLGKKRYAIGFFVLFLIMVFFMNLDAFPILV
ncbi:MAG: glycerol-3-phosphate acyltransferase [Promethearchaeota archaeon]|nr:MAG: glycerol-3-phosphate acyltransferase [Candidatus Lokiarchaeota archaeon]